MNDNHLTLDPRSLHIFVTVMHSDSITQAAEKLGVTQSAVSHALERLRRLFDDPLFVRSGRSVIPTQRAITLLPEVEALLANGKRLLQPQTLSPEKLHLKVKIATNDAIRDLLLPPFYQHLQQQTQRIELAVMVSEIPSVSLFRDDDIDFVLSPVVPDHGDLMVRRLFADPIVCFYDPKHRARPKSREDFTNARYISLGFLKNVQVDQRDKKHDDTTFIIDANVDIRVPNFAGIAAFLAGSDALAVAPRWLSHTSLADFAYTDWFFGSSPMNMHMVWHQKHQHDLRHRWLRDQLIETTEQLIKQLNLDLE